MCAKKSNNGSTALDSALMLMTDDEREMVMYIYNAIPEIDRKGLSHEDILTVLDLMDDYLEEKGLLREDEQSGEMEYIEGDVDETEQLAYVQEKCEEEGLEISGVQIQLIQDAELQYGMEQGYYEEDEE